MTERSFDAVVLGAGPGTTRLGVHGERGERRAEQALRRVRRVPPGFVTTYGDLIPGAPRMAGMALARCDDPDVPWQRVVRSDGSLAKGLRQRRLLEAEGVPFRGERVDMGRAWVPAR